MYTFSPRMASPRSAQMASPRSAQSTAPNQNAILITYEINDITYVIQDGISAALVKASALGHLDIVKALVDEGADINTVDHGSTPLTVASKNGEFEVVQYLCDKGAKVDQCDSRGLSALAYAVMHGFTDIVELLCRCGADANSQGRSIGTTILHDAVMSGDLKLVETLIKANASIDTKYLYKLTPTQLAKALNHFTIANLLRHAKAEKSDGRKKSGLFSRFWRKASMKGDTETVWSRRDRTRDVLQRSSDSLSLEDTDREDTDPHKTGVTDCEPDLECMRDETDNFRPSQFKRSESSRSWAKSSSFLETHTSKLSEQQLQNWENEEHIKVVHYKIWRSSSTGNSRPGLPFPNASEDCTRASAIDSEGLLGALSRSTSLIESPAETSVCTHNRSTGRNKYIFKNANFYIDQPELKSMNIDNAGNVAMNNSTINQSATSHGEQADASDDDSSDDPHCET